MLNDGNQVLRFRLEGPGSRLAAVDVVRGLAVSGMVLFHLNWDLAYLHWRETGPAGSAAWMAFGHVVAGTFLLLSGFGLVLAEHAGWRSAARRLAVIAGVALAITALTRWLFPQDYIFFGILHCIAVTNLIALPFLSAPLPVLVAAAGLAGAAPLFLSSARFDGPWGWWLGLSQTLPRTLDIRPVLPWLGLVLLGVVFARVCRGFPEWRPRIALSKALASIGRHSLLIYVAHQPVLLGMLLLAGLIRTPAPADWAQDFSRQCRTECTAVGAGREGCEAACECVRVGLAPVLGVSGAALPAPLHKLTQQDLEAASAACLRETSTDAGRKKAFDNER